MIETLWSKVRSLQIVLEQAKMINDTSGAIEAEMRLRGAALLLVSIPADTMNHVIWKVMISGIYGNDTGGDASHTRMMIESCIRHDLKALQPTESDLGF